MKIRMRIVKHFAAGITLVTRFYLCTLTMNRHCKFKSCGKFSCSHIAAKKICMPHRLIKKGSFQNLFNPVLPNELLPSDFFHNHLLSSHLRGSSASAIFLISKCSFTPPKEPVSPT